MAFDSMDEEGGAISQINVTPLVDVMLVLLIIFMVAAPILQQGVELDLPRETIAQIEGEGEQLVISVNKAGDVFIGSDNRIDLEKLGPKVKAIVEQKKNRNVYIRADKTVDYGKVMAVMGEVKRAGIEKVGLLTEPS